MIEDTHLVTQLPSNSWFEGFAGRPNGHILVARVDQPELYTLDAADPDAEPELLHTFPESVATGIIDICPLAGCENEYILLTGIVNLAAVKAKNFIIWRVILSRDDEDPPRVTKIAHLPDAALALGIATASERTLLVCDSGKNCIYRVDMRTGKSSMLVSDDSFRAASMEDFFGINALCIIAGYVWFTNSSCGILGRVPIRLDDGVEAGVALGGAVEVVTRDIPHCDGLAIAPDGSTAYTACYTDGRVWKADIAEDGTASTSVVVENLVNPTALELVATQGKLKLYVVCCGEIDVGWISSDRDSWKALAGINGSVTVRVTTEVVEVDEGFCT
ncbi:hypothetical protein BJ170DRAFT_418561 [Xylariales sp. AK1849]|nr:hypothetical protein BJ170DRAFT_418561 [Xylariales sp. AK1849]